MGKIKVIHFVSGLVSGGVEEMIINYCGNMDHSIYEFIVVYQHEAVLTCKEKIEAVGCRTIRITARNENFIRNVYESVKLLKNEKPDIVHSHMNLMNFCALFAAKRAGVKTRICHSHIAEKRKNVIYNVFASICKFFCIWYATDYFACGVEAAEYMYSKNKSIRNVRIVDNAIDIDFYSKSSELRDKMRIQHNLNKSFVVGHVGRFSYQKNHERLINIFYELLKQKENAVLLLVGTGEEKKYIEEMVDNLKIRNNVIFYGTTQKMNEVYSMMDVFVLPSRYEGLPVVSIEIQAANIPAVFSDAIAPSCKITDTISFVSLEEDDKVWVQTILEVYKNKVNHDLTELRNRYDIKNKAKKLDGYYREMISHNVN